MERRRTLVDRARLVGVALVVLAGATACGDGGLVGRGPVATVNGADVAADQVEDLVAAQRRFLELRGTGAEKQRVEAEGQGQEVVTAKELAANIDDQVGAFDGTGADSMSTSGAAQVLTGLIQDQIYRDALRSAGGKVTKEQRAAARSEIEQQITSLGVDVKDVPDVIVDQAVEQAAIRAAIQATAPDDVKNQPPLSDDEYTEQLRGLYDAQVGDLTQLCVNVIVTDDEASGQAARQAVEAGQSFADVAAEASREAPEAAVDGAGGCVAVADVAGVLGEDATTAEAGDLLGPGQGADGSFILVEVDRVQVPTFEEVRPQIEQANPNTSAEDASAALDKFVDDTFAKAATRADVTVDPRYGTWEPKTRQVVPPADPGAARMSPSSSGGGDGPPPTTAPAGP
ncbi:MAG: peptidyl-prolyl cis-trans isomerase [Acidimicrobiia bacterium]|nr:peptidyl-prolyl cis-trans isomerase [Acidimicrobiia bacterium]